MKAFLGIVVFVLVGLMTAIVIGFSGQFSTAPLPYDEEQQGLDKQITLKFNFVVAQNTPKGLAAQKFAEIVKQKTNGRVKVELFPDGSLYNDEDEIEALQRGNVQMIAPSFSNLSEFVPEWMVMDLPFAFANYDAVQEAFHGEIGKRLFQTLENRNMVGLAFWGNGFQQMTSNKGPLIHPNDFIGQKFRILPSKVIEAQFHAFGAETTYIPFNQLYHSLEQRAVDGEENTTSNIYSKKLYQVQKYVTISNHAYLGYAVLVNKKFWDGLPKDLRQDLADAIAETTEWENKLAIEVNQQQLEELKQIPSLNMHVLTPVETREWKQVLEPIYQKFEPIVGHELIEQIRLLQKKYPIGDSIDSRQKNGSG
jgi:tripartite ATP-independent transporter DctP family solute receptor